MNLIQVLKEKVSPEELKNSTETNKIQKENETPLTYQAIPSKNEDVFIDYLVNNDPVETEVYLYSDALDFNYTTKLTKYGDELIYVTAFLNLSFNNNLFISASNENTKASIPLTHIYDYCSVRSGREREAANNLARLYESNLKELSRKNGLEFVSGFSGYENFKVVFKKKEI